MADHIKRIRAAFYQLPSGKEPVRDWLKAMGSADRKGIGEDIAAVEFTWPVGMPLVRSMKLGLWELRTTLPGNMIIRVLFCVEEGRMVLLHGFIKKSQNTPDADLTLARKRQKEISR